MKRINGMIDYIKVVNRDKETLKRVYKNNLLVHMHTTYWPGDGKRNERVFELYKHRNMRFRFVINSEMELIELCIEGSLHYYMNDGKHNYNQFTFDQFIYTTNKFCSNFDLNPQECVLRPFEYGVNLNVELVVDRQTPITAQQIINSLICERSKMFRHNPSHILSSKRSGSPNHDYKLKAYSKTAEFPVELTDQELVRFEVQHNRMRCFARLGIICLSDLLIKGNHFKIMSKYMNYMRRIVILDPLIDIPKGSKYWKNLHQYEKMNFWQNLITQSKTSAHYRAQYDQHAKLLQKLSKRYGINLKEKLLKMLEAQYLSNLGEELIC